MLKRMKKICVFGNQKTGFRHIIEYLFYANFFAIS